jgi:hypothetical protein
LPHFPRTELDARGGATVPEQEFCRNEKLLIFFQEYRR